MKTFDELPGWIFEAEEVSNGWYKVDGVNELGQCVSADGEDLGALFEKCRVDALSVAPEIPPNN